MRKRQLFKVIPISIIMSVMCYCIYCVEVMVTLGVAIKSVYGFIGTRSVFCIILYTFMTIPFGILTEEELYGRYKIFYNISRKRLAIFNIVFYIAIIIFYVSQFDCDNSYLSSCWDLLEYPDKTVIMLKAMPKFYRDLVYVPLSGGGIVSDAMYYKGLVMFIIVLVLASLATLPLIEYYTYKSGCTLVRGFDGTECERR